MGPLGQAGSESPVLIELKPQNWETKMPLYEYICRKCRHKFDEVLSVKEHDTKKIRCPKCQSEDLGKVIEPFFAKTVSKTRSW
jgi:putative FmdB family regulatory protein